MKKVSIIIPAYNEAERIERTLQSIRLYVPHHELIVVDDGSRDHTMDVASPYADLVVRLPVNRGKGVALQTGWRQSSGDIVVMLDADLCESARLSYQLVDPVLADHCDMSVAQLPQPPRKAGMGMAKGLARTGIRMLTGYVATAPLSGQRAIRREALECIKSLDHGFGVEVGITVDIVRAGFRVKEVPIDFTHRYTGNNVSGYWHRGKEFVAIGRALGKKFKEGVTKK